MLGTICRLPHVWRRYKAARLEAEALVYHHGERGLAVALARAEAAMGEVHEVRCYRQLVASIAQRQHRLLSSSDTATRYEIVRDWERRPGQMIRPTLEDWHAELEATGRTPSW